MTRANILLVFLTTFSGFGFADGGNVVETVNAKVRYSCAPSDDRSIEIKIDKIDITINLYGEDIWDFEAGRPVTVNETPKKNGSEASLKEKPIGLEITANPKTKQGHATVNGAVHPLKIEWTSKTQPPCD